MTTTSVREVKWITNDMGRVFPEEWHTFTSSVERSRARPVIDAYRDAILDADPVVRQRAADAWCYWEDVHVSLIDGFRRSPRFEDPQFRLLFATLVIHYFAHAGFPSNGGILADMSSIADTPAVMIHGDLDISSPLATAWELHRLWPASELIVVGKQGHGGESMFEQLAKSATEFRPR